MSSNNKKSSQSNSPQTVPQEQREQRRPKVSKREQNDDEDDHEQSQPVIKKTVKKQPQRNQQQYDQDEEEEDRGALGNKRSQPKPNKKAQQRQQEDDDEEEQPRPRRNNNRNQNVAPNNRQNNQNQNYNNQNNQNNQNNNQNRPRGNTPRDKRQNGEYIRPFFQLIGLPQYTNDFADQGYDTLRNLLMVTPENMKEIGVKQAHIRVISEGISSRIVRVPLSSNVLSWEIDEVTNWLDRNGLSELKDTFVQNKFDGVMLCTVTDDQLKNDLNVTSLGTRNKVREQLERLKKPEKIYLDPTPRGISSVSNYRKQAKRPYLNYTLSVKIDNKEIVDKFTKVQETLKQVTFLSNERKYPDPNNFHITLALFQIDSQEKLTLAQETLKEVKKEVFPKFFNKKNPTVSFKGLRLFDNARVIWAEMSQDENKDQFLEFASAVSEKFQKAGLLQDRKDVAPHVTIMKQRQRLSNRRSFGIVERKIEDHQDEDFGEQSFDAIELLANDQVLEEGGFEIYGKQYFTKDTVDASNSKKRANFERPARDE